MRFAVDELCSQLHRQWQPGDVACEDPAAYAVTGLDEADLHAGAGQLARCGQPGSTGADDGYVERLSQRFRVFDGTRRGMEERNARVCCVIVRCSELQPHSAQRVPSTWAAGE